MKDIIIDCFKTIKQNYIIFMLSVVAFAALNMCEFTAMLDYLTYPTISLALYMTLMKKKKINWKTLALYFAFYAGSYLLYYLTLTLFTHIVPVICVKLAMNFDYLKFLLNTKIALFIWTILSISISMPILARLRIILPFVLSENKYSMKELFQKSQIKYINLIFIVLLLYTTATEASTQEGIVKSIAFAITIPLICVFNFCFYKSRETPKERNNS